MARAVFRVAPPGVRAGESPGRPGIPYRLPDDVQGKPGERVARHVLHRRIACAALDLRPGAGQGIRGLARESDRLAHLREIATPDLAALSLPGAVADTDGLHFSRHAGF